MPVARPYWRHETAIIDGEKAENGFCDPNVGAGTKVWHHVHLCDGATIGRNCNLGQNVFVAPTALLGQGCKIQNNVNIYDGVELDDFVFCGPSMTFTNLSSPLPRSAIARRNMYQVTRVRKHASIGAGAVIVCGLELGEACFVGAGAVVTRNVPAYALVVGNPAKVIGWACQCGERISFASDEIRCEGTYDRKGSLVACGRVYLRRGDRVTKSFDPHEE